MDIEKIELLKNQAKEMDKTLINLGEAFQALCKITKKLAIELDKIQREFDDQEEYRMEQNERR